MKDDTRIPAYSQLLCCRRRFKPVGDVAGSDRADGFRKIAIDGRSYLTNRLAVNRTSGLVGGQINLSAFAVYDLCHSKRAAGPEWLHFLRRARKKSLAGMRGFLFYLLRPEPGPMGVNVDPLGEALGPRVFPDGLWVLFGEVTDAPAVPVVLPLDVEPVALPVAAEPAEVPPAPDADAPPACASANVLENAKAVANASVAIFMVVSFS